MIAVSNILTAIAPTFEALAATRVICALALPVFWAKAQPPLSSLAGLKAANLSRSFMSVSRQGL